MSSIPKRKQRNEHHNDCLKTQLTISFIENQEPQVFQSNFAAIDDVVETTGRSNNQVTTFVEFTHLIAGVVSAVKHGGTHARAIRELLCLFKDLRSQLAGWGEDQAERILLATIVGTI